MGSRRIMLFAKEGYPQHFSKGYKKPRERMGTRPALSISAPFQKEQRFYI
jgi:hypothetical protein